MLKTTDQRETARGSDRSSAAEAPARPEALGAAPGDTIFALASAPGRAGVAVVRVSGPAAGTALRSLTGAPLPSPRHAQLRRLRDPADETALDQGLVLWFPAPASFTGEDVAEFHLHGGPAVVAALAKALAGIAGLRRAEPGEFTRRAFGHGKLDLTAAEGLADLVAAETEAQRRQALRQMQGELGRLYEGWRERLVRMLGQLEAAIDFPDEDLPSGLLAEVSAAADALRRELAGHLADAHRGERLRDGYTIAIVGPPNAGKSSLLNALARREAAIVAATPGTTRDVVEVHLDLGGYPVILADTAGLRAPAEEVEAEGVRRAKRRAEQADLIVGVFDLSTWPELDRGTLDLLGPEAAVVLNKSDIAPLRPAGDAGGCRTFILSTKTGDGLPALLDWLRGKVTENLAPRESPALTRARHRGALESAHAALAAALQADSPELVAEDLRLVARELGRLTGRVDVEEILDVIFREFCIGK